jgi:aspartate/methionine/tyrosine aminotransferase
MEKHPTGKNAFIPPSQYYPNYSSLDSAYVHAQCSGHPPKVLLISHPNNPLGISYPPSVVNECIQWARDRKVHLISDEIYAGSVYRSFSEGENNNSGPFQSILKLASTQKKGSTHPELGLGPYIHFVYALSKDFALSGLRVGVAYTENESIRLPMQKLNDLCQVSSQTQSTVERMLNAFTSLNEHDGAAKKLFWSTDVFLKENRKRIKSRCDRLQGLLQKIQIPYIPADSGMYLWLDLSKFLKPDSSLDDDSKERLLYLKLLEHGLLLTPGRSMKNSVPGFFRFVFTAATDGEFDLALTRMSNFVHKMQS